MLKGRTPLVIAVGLGLLAGVVSWTAIRASEARARRGFKPVEVIVASAELSEGTVLTRDLLAVRPVPEQFATASVVRPDSVDLVLGLKLLVPMQAGDPLLLTLVDSAAASTRLATKVQKKATAITLNVSGAAGVGGWVRPNDHVNIIGTFKDTDGQLVATTLLQNQVVLATGTLAGTGNNTPVTEGDRSYSTITLMVIPEVAEALVLAEELGSLTFTLRNGDDLDTIAGGAHTGISTLLSGERMHQLAEKHRATIEMIRGGGDVKHEAVDAPSH